MLTGCGVNGKKQGNREDCCRVLIEINNFGWLSLLLSLENKQRITRVISILFSYDYDYRIPFAHSTIMVWDTSALYTLIEGHAKVNEYLYFHNIGSTSYLNRIETQHPGYLHHVHRCDTTTLGVNSNFNALAIAMNQKSYIPSKIFTILYITRRKVNDWFVANKQKELLPEENPLDTTKIKRKD